MAFPQSFSGYQRITSSGVIGTSGNPLIFYGYSLHSGGTVSSGTFFFNGTSTSGGTVFQNDPSNAAINADKMVTLPVGVTFPSGCYVSFDGNATAVTVFYTEAF